MVKVMGRAQYSFQPGHYAVESDKGVIYVDGRHIGLKERKELEAATGVAGNIDMNLPSSALEFIGVLGDESAFAQRTVAAVQEEPDGLRMLNPGLAMLNGKKTMAWQESYYLISADDRVYRIWRRDLSAAHIKRLDSAAFGERVNLAVPIQSIELAWSHATAEQEKDGPEFLNRDSISVAGSTLTITGTVLWNWSDSRSEVVAKDWVFRFQKSQAVPDRRGKLDLPGARAEVTMPIAAVEAVWYFDSPSLDGGSDSADLMP